MGGILVMKRLWWCEEMGELCEEMGEWSAVR